MEYEPPENVLRCSAPEEMERFIREDSLSLIAMWSVDFAWDGKVHRAAKVLRQRGTIGRNAGRR